MCPRACGDSLVAVLSSCLGDDILVVDPGYPRGCDDVSSCGRPWVSSCYASLEADHLTYLQVSLPGLGRNIHTVHCFDGK